MRTQISYKNNVPTLYIVPTPIGNLDDMTYRAVKTLESVDVIYAEDTRHSGQLLKHFNIKTPQISYHKHNEQMRIESIIETLKEGKHVALISDAGTPLISDPGQTLVKAIIEAEYNVVSLPGASALLPALTSSALPTDHFLFYGFLPAKLNARETALNTLKKAPYTLVFYEAPHRIKDTLKSLYTVFKKRNVALAREISKQYETFYWFNLEDHQDLPELKGEIVLIVDGFNEVFNLNEDDLIAHIELLMQDGLKEMDAIKTAAKERKMKKNEAYMAFQIHKKNFQKKE